jgi:4'-phosphopantetheinyl transferase
VILAVISRRQPVGVDVEALNRDVDADALTQRVCTEAERQWWTARPDSQKRDAFLQLWTCKEAFVKATGQGLRSGADTVECVFEEDRIIGLNTAPGPPPSSPPADQWALRPLSVSSNLVGAVVRKGTLTSPLPCVDAAPLLERLSKT